MFDLEWVLNRDAEFRVQLLGRMKFDCDSALEDKAYGHLWAKNEKEQIHFMKAIWNSLPEEEKPEWLSLDEIIEYENKMVNS